MKAHQNNPQQGNEQVSDQVKFSVFQSIMDSLFQSFSASVSFGSFEELSACVFRWIEEHCKPQVTYRHAQYRAVKCQTPDLIKPVSQVE